MEQPVNLNPAAQAGASQNPGDNCIFCHIANGKVQAKKVYEDSLITAVLDINPANPGHCLLIPKTHYSLMMQIPENEIGQMFVIAKKVSNAILKALGCEGTNIYVANGAVAGQKAPHFMIHVIPRMENDGLNLSIPNKQISETELSEFHNKILLSVKQKFG